MRHGTFENESPPFDPSELNKRITEGNSSFVPSDPSQFGKMGQLNDVTNNQNPPRDLDRVFRLIPKLSEVLPPFVWPQIIEALLEKLWSYPRDSIVVQFLNKISPQLSDNSNLVFQKIIQKLDFQTDLNSEVFSSNNNSFVVEHLIFERLAPLLVLKMLSVDSFKTPTKEKEQHISKISEIMKNR